MAKKTTKKTAKKKAAKRGPKVPEQIEVLGAEDERHQYHPDIDPIATEACDIVQQQEYWRKQGKEKRKELDAALDKAGVTDYFTGKGHRVERSAGDPTTKITLKKDKDGIMEEPDGVPVVTEKITVGS